MIDVLRLNMQIRMEIFQMIQHCKRFGISKSEMPAKIEAKIELQAGPGTSAEGLRAANERLRQLIQELVDRYVE